VARGDGVVVAQQAIDGAHLVHVAHVATHALAVCVPAAERPRHRCADPTGVTGHARRKVGQDVGKRLLRERAVPHHHAGVVALPIAEVRQGRCLVADTQHVDSRYYRAAIIEPLPV